MSATSIVALVVPIVPLSLLLFTLNSTRGLGVLAPAQFAALAGSVILAVRAGQVVGQVGASLTLLLAIAGLCATVLRTDHVARNAHLKVDWQRFEREFRFYAIICEF